LNFFKFFKWVCEGDCLQSVPREVSVLVGYCTTLLGGCHETFWETAWWPMVSGYICKQIETWHKESRIVIVCGVPLIGTMAESIISDTTIYALFKSLKKIIHL
jgi:hypothetical protein